ncbi:DJ-1/PfpI family protein [Cellulophaga baltica]|uniref:DJ-1/PfpI family protein n=1 Tax=Cellulophaga TaxID=104264 RepID=UPI001C06913C|nr:MULTISPECIES: DJ-1/PfpI family protein [Cellulophaga]MBU2995321.1 DJ-1/PfpI family protein [Cellulophaga baltica]MDO6766716.1 DJ-1/PfpI family protein [Cellulophaga sp. 1_MG-2023]
MKKLILLIIIGMITNISLSAQNNKILFVLSAADTLELNKGQKLRQTGVFLNEFYLAYKSVSENGYTVEFATPNGVVTTIDEESINDKYWKEILEIKNEAIEFITKDNSFNNPITLENAIENQGNYIGIIIPGGQGLMIDLIVDKNIPTLLKHFAKKNKPTGLICHAPSLILTIPAEENPYIGYKVNSVSPIEEFVIEKFIMKGKPKNRKIARQLRKFGMKYKSGLPKSNFAIKDRNLVTSQNPFSGNSFNILYLEALTEYLETKK